MKVSIHQPDYIPWIGLFYKMFLSDVFIHLDDVQYSNTGAHNYNVIKTAQGELRLKFPVEYHFGNIISEARPKYELNWREKHLRTLEMNYSKAKFFKDTFPELQDVIMVDYPNVAELNIAINEYIAKRFGITPKFIRSSEFAIETKREEKVIDLCVAVGGTCYISGNGARVYQDPKHFLARDVELTYLDYKPIKYPQVWNEFLPCLSVLDYIFNCGYDWEYVLKKVAEQNERDR